jgi:hypothetical protein
MPRFAGDSSGSPRGGLTAVSVEPLGAVARRGFLSRVGREPLRHTDASTTSGGLAIAVAFGRHPAGLGVKGAARSSPLDACIQFTGWK